MRSDCLVLGLPGGGSWRLRLLLNAVSALGNLSPFKSDWGGGRGGGPMLFDTCTSVVSGSRLLLLTPR